MALDWNRQLLGQLEFYWDFHLRPRLAGLTDEEYLWEPVAGCWSVRRTASGDFEPDSAAPEPDPPPVTTIAWRMVHIGAFCLGNRAEAFFGTGSAGGAGLAGSAGGAVTMFDKRFVPRPLPGTAQEAIAYLERAYAAWHDGVAALGEDGLARPLGPRGAGFADEPMAALVLHLNREVMHHGGEIGVLRDLYRVSRRLPMEAVGSPRSGRGTG
ncbi:MAG TPA: DinB family protein [Pseudonocardiaceae bacterium]|nr:DinB family protein [Pseudonocardiaceae bacterium]